MSHEIRADYSQMWMFPPSLDDLLEKDHPARFIREFVDALDLQELGFRMRKGEEGRPNYAADLLLKVWLYGYLERIRSSRRLERACRQHVALMWLTGRNNPDHNSLWRFWRDNRGAIKRVLRQTVRVAVKAGLVDMVLHAVDGTKITARASTDKSWNRKQLERRLARLDKSLDEAMAEVEAAEQEESGEYRLPEELAEQEKLRATIREQLVQLKAEERKHMHPGEPEAQMMKNHEGTRLGYNAQVVVDSKAGVIVAAEVTTDQNDRRQLMPMLEAVEKEVGRVADETVADAGYFSGEQLDKAQQAEFAVLVNLDEVRKAEEEGGRYHSSKFTYVAERNCFICPRGEKLEYAGAARRKDRSYETRRYRCHSWRECPVRWECSKNKRGRGVEWNPYTGAILRQKEKQKDRTKAGLLRRRMGIAEPAFARVKHWLEFRRWTMGGLAQVRAQWLFVCALANLSRLYPFWKEGKLQLV